MSTSTRILAIFIIVVGVALLFVTISAQDSGTSETPGEGEVGAALTYEDIHISIRYPIGYTADRAYLYQAFGPGKDIAGVKFTIPPTLAEGTNLASDTYISVEQIPTAKNCAATDFLADPVIPNTVTENDTRYSVAS